MKPRIFISHSTKEDPAARGILDELCDFLESAEQGYSLLVDKDLLKVGDHWRKKLLDGLGNCHGGIILLNEKALNSDFVHTEASILRWRNLNEKNFPLAIIRLGEVTPSSIRKHGEWSPLEFLELQILPSGKEKLTAENKNDIFSEITDLFSPLKELLGVKTPFKKILERVVFLLDTANLPDPLLIEFLEEYKTKISSVRNINALTAEMIMQEGIDGLESFLHSIAHVITPENVPIIEQLINTIAPMWVNPKDITPLFFIVNKEISKRNCSLNGRKVNFTPTMYVNQAKFQDSTLGWKIHALSSTNDDRNIEMFVSEIEDFLVEKVLYDLKLLPPSRRSRQLIKNRLDQYQKRGRPVFVAFSPELAERQELIDLIRREYPSLTFFFLTDGNKKVVPVEASQLPQLDLEIETKKESQYLGLMCDFCSPP